MYAFMRELVQESLRDWFKKEKWVRITTSGNIAGPCGTSKNKKNPDRCLPAAKARSLTKAQRAATARKKKKAGAKGQTVVKNTKKATVRKENLDPSYKHDGKSAPYGSGYRPIKKEDVKNLIVGLLQEYKKEKVVTEKDDRCTRIAKRKYDTWPSAYASGAVVRCRRGEIWKGVKEETLNEMDGGQLFDYFAKKGYKVTERRPDGKEAGFEGYMVSKGDGPYPQSVIFQYNKDVDQFMISRMGGYRIDQEEAMKAGMRQAGYSGVAGRDSYITDGNYTPVDISVEDLKDIVDHVMTGLDREAEAQADFYKARGRTSGTIDEMNCKHGKYFCPHDKVYKCRKGPKKSK